MLYVRKAVRLATSYDNLQDFSKSARPSSVPKKLRSEVNERKMLEADGGHIFLFLGNLLPLQVGLFLHPSRCRRKAVAGRREEKSSARREGGREGGSVV